MHRILLAPSACSQLEASLFLAEISFTTWFFKFQICKSAFVTDPWLHRDKTQLKNHFVSLWTLGCILEQAGVHEQLWWTSGCCKPVSAGTSTGRKWQPLIQHWLLNSKWAWIWFFEMNLFPFFLKCKRSLCLKKSRDTVTVRRCLLSVGKAFASSSHSINQAVFMERSGKATDAASSLQGDSRATRFLVEKRHMVLTERICGFAIFCLIIVCNLQKANAF